MNFHAMYLKERCHESHGIYLSGRENHESHAMYLKEKRVMRIMLST
jgi:hypothetical protein